MNFCQKHEQENALILPQVADLPKDLNHSTKKENTYIWIYIYVYIYLLIVSCVGIHSRLKVRKDATIKYPP